MPVLAYKGRAGIIADARQPPEDQRSQRHDDRRLGTGATASMRLCLLVATGLQVSAVLYCSLLLRRHTIAARAWIVGTHWDLIMRP